MSDTNIDLAELHEAINVLANASIQASERITALEKQSQQQAAENTVLFNSLHCALLLFTNEQRSLFEQMLTAVFQQCPDLEIADLLRDIARKSLPVKLSV
jgi:hypothetical protein